MKKFNFAFTLIVFVFIYRSFAQPSYFIVVAKDGNGDFKTVTEAISSLPVFNYERIVIFIKNGVYNEKIRIEQDNLTLKGENKDSTIIEFSQLRTDWEKTPDHIGAAVLNIYGDDIILDNLTIRNTQPEIGPHAFAVYGMGTRIVIINCNILSKGADTISLWNYKNGMYYHANCCFEGSVDFVCPRGWCFIKDSKFYELKQTASLWHAGGYDINQKFVLKNCSFDGVKGFQLGRHHYDAQFYLLDCVFSENMADTPIYRVTYKDNPSKDRPSNWGERSFFYNCVKRGKVYDWIRNNLDNSPGSPKPFDINAPWTFGDKWNPESTEGPKIIKHEIHKNYILLFFTEPITIFGKPELRSETGSIFTYDSGAGSGTIQFKSITEALPKDLSGLHISNDGKILGTIASVKDRSADLIIN
jgi:pectinesterase